MRDINEADWRLWRKVANVACERFCEQTLAKIMETASSKEDVFDRYGIVKAILRDTDKKLENAFSPVRRSTALQQLAYAVAEGMVSRQELAQFSDEAQQVVKLWLRE